MHAQMPPGELGGSTGAVGGADVAVVVGAGAETASGGGAVTTDDLLDERHLAAVHVRVDRAAGETPPSGDEHRLCGFDPRLRGPHACVGVVDVVTGEAELPVGRGDPFGLRVDLRLEAR